MALFDLVLTPLRFLDQRPVREQVSVNTRVPARGMFCERRKHPQTFLLRFSGTVQGLPPSPEPAVGVGAGGASRAWAPWASSQATASAQFP